MKHIVYLLLLSTATLSCTQNKTPADSVQTDKVSTDKDSSLQAIKADQVIFEDKKLHAFSDHTKQDSFKLEVSGNQADYQNAKVTFQIISHSGKEIYKDQFDGVFLID